jgi:hypothetical protein
MQPPALAVVHPADAARSIARPPTPSPGRARRPANPLNKDTPMRISAGCRIVYDCPQPTPMLLMVSPHPSRMPDLVGPHGLAFDPPVAARHYADSYGNRCTRTGWRSRRASSWRIPERPMS